MRITALTVLCSAVFSPSLLAAQKLPPDPFLRWMDRIAQQQLDKRESIVAAIHTIPEAERRKQWVRETLLDILGGLPHYHGPLRARITGRIEAGGYTIERLLFESLPGFFVTADVYRPTNPVVIPEFSYSRGIRRRKSPSRNGLRQTWL